MVEDWHHNIFQPYGGKLLEDDVTKALINILEKCDREKVLKPFLKEIMKETIPKIIFPNNLENIKFNMQETPTDEAKKSKQKYVVGISPKVEDKDDKKEVSIDKEKLKALSKKYGKESNKYKSEKSKIEKLIDEGGDIKKSDLPKDFQEIFGKNKIAPDKLRGGLQYVYDVVFRESRPDAMIWCKSQDFAILIENKIYDEQFPSQIERHRKSMEGNVKEIKKSWMKDIYPEFKRIEKGIDIGKKKQGQESKESFLLKEFREYLEAIGLAPFRGFEKEDFALWMDNEKAFEAGKRRVKERMDSLVKEVHERLSKQWPGELEYADVGSVKKEDGYVWGYISREKNQSDITHFNFVIRENAFEVGITSELKKAVTTFNENISKDVEKFDKILKEIAKKKEDIYFESWWRIPTGKPREFDSDTVCELYLRQVDPKMCREFFKKMVDKYKKGEGNRKIPALNFKVRYLPSEAIKKKEGLADKCVEVIKQLKELHDFANR